MKTFGLLLSLLLVGFYVLVLYFNNVDRFSSDAFIQAVSDGKVVDDEWKSFKRVSNFSKLTFKLVSNFS